MPSASALSSRHRIRSAFLGPSCLRDRSRRRNSGFRVVRDDRVRHCREPRRDRRRGRAGHIAERGGARRSLRALRARLRLPARRVVRADRGQSSVLCDGMPGRNRMRRRRHVRARQPERRRGHPRVRAEGRRVRAGAGPSERQLDGRSMRPPGRPHDRVRLQVVRRRRPGLPAEWLLRRVVVQHLVAAMRAAARDVSGALIARPARRDAAMRDPCSPVSRRTLR
jgi:hypothetical protein